MKGFLITLLFVKQERGEKARTVFQQAGSAFVSITPLNIILLFQINFIA